MRVHGLGRPMPYVQGAMNDRLPGAKRTPPATRYTDHPLPETLAEAERLAESIERAVWQETRGRVRNLRVRVGHHGVTLTGRCTTYYTKQQAQHAAMAFPGNHSLNNEIEVS